MSAPDRLQDSTYAAILKVLQEGTMQSTLSESSEMWNYIQKNLKKYPPEGKKLTRSLLTKRGFAAVGSIGSDGSFKSKQSAGFSELVAEPKFMTAHIEIPWAVYNAGKTERGAFAKPMAVEIEDKQIALAKQMTREVMADGSGVLATISSFTADGTSGEITISTSNSDQGCIRWLELNDHVEIYTSTTSDTKVTDYATSGTVDYAKITDVDEDNNTVTIRPYDSSDSALDYADGSLAAGNLIVRADVTYNIAGTVADFGDRSEELVGLEALINDSGKVHGISRASVPSYASYVKDVGGEILTTDAIQAALSGANKKGDGKPEIALMSHNSYNRFVEIAEEDRRLISTNDAKLGFERVGYMSHFGAVKFVIELYARDDRIFLIDPRYLELYGNDFSFFEENGETIWAVSSASGGYTPDFSAELIGACEMFNCKPSAMSRIEGYILK